ncbi:hypothetical protein AMELA_G00064260 [Ameiurus melas]|uniref:Uncharacterized protein n=1 Tax=Ameiurus melas TaxID=219545 RepID=A0A7J6B5A2_AMEME|nr:hypothetical protein AMELA_G00064260 [Ameiurus melas]
MMKMRSVSPPIGKTVQYNYSPIASARILCERGGIKRLKGRGSNFGRDRRGSNSLFCASPLPLLSSTPTLISTAISPACSAQGQERERRGRGTSHRESPDCNLS